MTTPYQTDSFTSQREAMVKTQLRARGIRDERVLAAMSRVPRHEFVAGDSRSQAYEDHPLPIAEGQTVSQPYIVARMLEGLALDGSEIVLEVGTGSGYQTALLAELCRHVESVERHESLAGSAKSTLARLGYRNATVTIGDGSQGLAQRSPFDAVIVSAAAPQIPQALLEQLREGGRLVIPVGPASAQDLQLVYKRAGKIVVESLDGCRFVPLIGEQGYKDGW